MIYKRGYTKCVIKYFIMKETLLSCLIGIFGIGTLYGEEYRIHSPNNKLNVILETDSAVYYRVDQEGRPVLRNSPIGIDIAGSGKKAGKLKVATTKHQSVDEVLSPVLYKKSEVRNRYNEFTIRFKQGWGVQFRVYDDGMAYRILLENKKPVAIQHEIVAFNFMNDHACWVPYVCDLRDDDPYCSAFESLYDEVAISGMKPDSLAHTPFLVALDNERKVLLFEAGLENYPGMYLTLNERDAHSLKGEFAKIPSQVRLGGFNDLNLMPVERAEEIALLPGKSQLPWRGLIVSNSDAELLDSDIIFKLSDKSRIQDVSWIIPGKSTWDWWNNWNIRNVDFNAGVNTDTYLYYIDFAAAHNLQYVVMDEGWAVNPMDLDAINPDIDLERIFKHGASKEVRVILWTTWYALSKDPDQYLKKYKDMGAAGFKIDFFDRDDQQMVRSAYEIAEKAAAHKLVLDYHGFFKPSGLNFVYPNILSFEGVRGLENCKWHNYDAMRYDVTMPFIRMVSGPVDYTPGAMRNSNRLNFRPIDHQPMSQGTRAHQLALYCVFDSPLQMLAESPSLYLQDKECIRIIEQIPTVFDQTIALDSKVGSHVTVTKRKGEDWFIGGITNWDARDVNVDFSFLPEGIWEVKMIRDGVNAGKDGTDYVLETFTVDNQKSTKIQMAPGGGFAMILKKRF